MDWLEVSVAADSEAVEAVAERLRRIGHGVAIEVPFIQASPDDAPVEDGTRRAIVKTYLPDDSEAPRLCQEIERDLWHLGQLRSVESLTTRRVAEEDWATAWKAFFPIMTVGKSTVIVPAWRRYRARDGEVVLRLDPGLAFGTGTHPTTRLCLCAVETLVQAGARVLDAGTGSGILALAAAGRSAGRVVALDVDPLAVSAAQANVRLNRQSRRVALYLGGPDAGGRWRRHAPFDVILANITMRENSRLAGTFAALMHSDSRLVASGILSVDAPQPVAAFEAAGLEVLDCQEDGDWTALIARLRP